MADLKLTKAEKKAESYLEWDDASLGRAVRALISNIENSGKDCQKEMLRMGACSAFFLLVGLAVNSNAATFELEMDGVTVGVPGGGKKKVGKWRLELKQLETGDYEEMINEQVKADKKGSGTSKVSLEIENP